MTETKVPSIDEQLHALAAPLHDSLKRVEKELRVAQALVEGLRADRGKIRSALRAVDPTFEPENKPGPKKNGHGTYGVKPATVDALRELLEAHRDELNGDGFTGTQISHRPDWHYSSATTSQALRALHDRGIVRLSKRIGAGGSKLYKLV
jgi:hypothetical protein